MMLVKGSVRRCAAGLLGLVLGVAAAGCSPQAPSVPALTAPSTVLGRSPAGTIVVGSSIARADSTSSTTGGQSVLYWTIAANDYCPQKAGSVTITAGASNSLGTAFSGNFSSAIQLTDEDTSGATKLSRSSIASPSQSVTLTYSGASIAQVTIKATLSGAGSTTLVLAPKSACVNASPDILSLYDGAPGSILTLAGSDATGTYNLGSSFTGATHACSVDVQIYQKTTTTFNVVSEFLSGRPFPVGAYACSIYATSDSGNVITAHPVLILD